MFEPEDRVLISNTNPDPIKNIYTIRDINVVNKKINDQLEIDKIILPLNKNLIAITGGKGSGKTALLDLIANCFIDQCSRSGSNENSFIQRIEEQANDLQVSINFLDEEIPEFSKKITDELFFTNTKITYLPQGKIEEYTSETIKLEEKIKEVIFNNKIVVESELKKKYDGIIKILKNNDEKIRNFNSKIYSIIIKTSNEIGVKISQSISMLEGELKFHHNKLDQFLLLVDSVKKAEIESLKEDGDSLRINLNQLAKLRNSTVFFLEELDRIEYINQSINKINELAKGVISENNIPIIDISIQKKLAQKLITKATNIVKIIQNEINFKSEEISNLIGLEKEHGELLNFIKNTNDNIERAKSEKEEYDRNVQEIQNLKNQRLHIFKSTISQLFEVKEMYNQIIETFTSEKNEILKEIDFKPVINFDSEKFLENADDLFHGKKVKEEKIEILKKKYKILIKNKEDIEKHLKDYFDYALKLKNGIKSSRNLNHFYDLIFSNHFQILTEIYYNKKLMEKLSLGQKGTVLLKLLLAEGNYPLLIDQPEGDLDNKFIYRDLVTAIKDAKKNRQILISTHNANLVVNTDAEQIIVANYENNKIYYDSGSLENPKIKSEITELLEGGMEAFKKRERKYGF